MIDDKRRNPVLACLSVLMVVALWSLPFLQIAPNRLVSGQAMYFFSIIPGSAWLLLVVLVAFSVAAMFKPRAAWLWSALAAAAVSMPSLLWLATERYTVS